MKKSEIYRVAQAAVLKANLSVSVALEVLRELMAKEDLEAFCERQKEVDAE